MHPMLSQNGEINLLTESPRHTAVDGLEQWQVDALLTTSNDTSSSASSCLMSVDYIVTEWLKTLTSTQWNKIKRQQSLFGIKLPEKWIAMWRFVLKEPNLRDAELASRGGRSIGSYTHLWNLWSEECIRKYTDELDKELLDMVDQGYLYSEIGDILLGRYGNQFWKPRKAKTKTTPSQVVNNYLYLKIPTKIARGELTELCLRELKQAKMIKQNKQKEYLKI